LNEKLRLNYFDDEMDERLTVALMPGYKLKEAMSQKFRTSFIQDEDRVIPNDQELTRWMKKCMNGDHDRFDSDNDWFRIQFCKIFVNPKAGKFPIDQDIIDEECTPRYKIVVHYSVPKGYWHVVDVPDMGEGSEREMQKRFESVYRRSSHKKIKGLNRNN
jgi:hypothetical protein